MGDKNALKSRKERKIKKRRAQDLIPNLPEIEEEEVDNNKDIKSAESKGKRKRKDVEKDGNDDVRGDSEKKKKRKKSEKSSSKKEMANTKSIIEDGGEEEEEILFKGKKAIEKKEKKEKKMKKKEEELVKDSNHITDKMGSSLVNTTDSEITPSVPDNESPIKKSRKKERKAELKAARKLEANKSDGVSIQIKDCHDNVTDKTVVENEHTDSNKSNNNKNSNDINIIDKKKKKEEKESTIDIVRDDSSKNSKTTTTTNSDEVSKKEKKKEGSKSKKNKKDKKTNSSQEIETEDQKSKNQNTSALDSSPRSVPSGHVTTDSTKAVSDKTSKKASSSSTTTTSSDNSKSTKKTTITTTETNQGSSRFIVFVGNLPYTATTSSIKTHFSKLNPKSVRHLTKKNDPNNASRGMAFVEFENYDTHKTALKIMHHSIFDDGKSEPRMINVELTAGGGGNTDDRKAKIKTKNERLNQQRARRLEEEEKAKLKKEEEKAKQGKISSSESAQNFSESCVHPSRRRMITA